MGHGRAWGHGECHGYCATGTVQVKSVSTEGQFQKRLKLSMKTNVVDSAGGLKKGYQTEDSGEMPSSSAES